MARPCAATHILLLCHLIAVSLQLHASPDASGCSQGGDLFVSIVFAEQHCAKALRLEQLAKPAANPASAAVPLLPHRPDLVKAEGLGIVIEESTVQCIAVRCNRKPSTCFLHGSA